LQQEQSASDLALLVQIRSQVSVFSPRRYTIEDLRSRQQRVFNTSPT
jgi:hypothetical protein